MKLKLKIAALMGITLSMVVLGACGGGGEGSAETQYGTFTMTATATMNTTTTATATTTDTATTTQTATITQTGVTP